MQQEYFKWLFKNSFPKKSFDNSRHKLSNRKESFFAIYSCKIFNYQLVFIYRRKNGHGVRESHLSLENIFKGKDTFMFFGIQRSGSRWVVQMAPELCSNFLVLQKKSHGGSVLDFLLKIFFSLKHLVTPVFFQNYRNFPLRLREEQKKVKSKKLQI